MCDYSLMHVASRPASVGDKLVSAKFPNTITRGFSSVDDPHTAVCLLPGTEIAFDEVVSFESPLGYANERTTGKVARFRQVDTDQAYVHHDALEFPDGQIVLLTRLGEGQRATVLQLPASSVGADGKIAEVTRLAPVA